MSPDRRQLLLLVRNALRMDFRPRGAEAESRWRRARPLFAVLAMYGLIGASLGLTLGAAPIPLFHKTFVLYAMAAMLVILNLMVEYQEILFSPADADVLGWRPIASDTLYAARVLHVLVYVGLLTAAQLAVPAVMVGVTEGGLVAAAFAVGALGNALLATGVILVLYGLLLRRLSPDRFQDVLGWVQLGFMVTLLFAYQLLSPRALGTAFGESSPVEAWFRFLPPGWYAALPTLAAGPFAADLAALLLAGTVVLVLVWTRALARLAPGYALEVESVRVASASAPSRPARPSPGARLMGRWLGRQPLRLLGFDFLLAQMRGDRRIRLALLPLVAFPLALTLAGLILSRGMDPYAVPGAEAASEARTASGAPPLPGANLAPAPATLPSSPERDRGVMVLFLSVYMMGALAATIGHGIGRSPDWRAAWVFHAAPVARYDQFYSGVMWGVLYALVLPAVALVGLVLLVAWRDPAHVIAHIALPAGLALLGFSLGAALRLELPFTREPLRHARGVRAAISLLTSVPLFAIAALHYLGRHRLPLLVLAGVLCAATGMLAWSLAARRLRSSFHGTAFEG